jgi:hypothetical protein
MVYRGWSHFFLNGIQFLDIGKAKNFFEHLCTVMTTALVFSGAIFYTCLVLEKLTAKSTKDTAAKDYYKNDQPVPAI